ncbi:hypothetical protein [Sphingomonas bacterium]|nr:hypothetical protein [Sphingomonas bacterium]
MNAPSGDSVATLQRDRPGGPEHRWDDSILYPVPRALMAFSPTRHALAEEIFRTVGIAAAKDAQVPCALEAQWSNALYEEVVQRVPVTAVANGRHDAQRRRSKASGPAPGADLASGI